VLHRRVRQCRVLYYSAEDGRKRLTRRLRNIVEAKGLDRKKLRENLLLLDASEVEPLYGETVENGDGKRSTFVKMLGPGADFRNLQKAVEAFDPQLVIVDGASDTFDGNEIVRRDVRAFIKLLRRVHPLRPRGVLLPVHIDRGSARGHTSNDDGYAGSAQWHSSCRRSRVT
jgi:RecA-family ATPase